MTRWKYILFAMLLAVPTIILIAESGKVLPQSLQRRWISAKSRLLVGRPVHSMISREHADITSISTALKMFQVAVGRFPTSEAGLEALVTRPNGLTSWQGPYRDMVPMDRWGNDYVYVCPGKRNLDFDLSSPGYDRIPNTNDDIMN